MHCKGTRHQLSPIKVELIWNYHARWNLTLLPIPICHSDFQSRVLIFDFCTWFYFLIFDFTDFQISLLGKLQFPFGVFSFLIWISKFCFLEFFWFAVIQKMEVFVLFHFAVFISVHLYAVQKFQIVQRYAGTFHTTSGMMHSWVSMVF